MTTHQKVFTRIYDEQSWTGGSGSGSHPDNTTTYRQFLQNFFKRYNIRSVVDFGCGDWQSTQLIDWSGISYHGIDVVEAVISENSRQHGSETIRFSCADLLEEPLPAADLLIIKDVLQHWSNEQVHTLLPRLAVFRCALITNTIATYEKATGELALTELPANCDITSGGFRAIDLAEPPFEWPVTEVFRHTSFRQSMDAEEIKATVLFTN